MIFEQTDPGRADGASEEESRREIMHSTEVTLSGTAKGMVIVMDRPNETVPYALFFDDGAGELDEVALVTSDTADARRKFDQIVGRLRKEEWKTRDQAKAIARNLVTALNGDV
jgi:hypothetical protein